MTTFPTITLNEATTLKTYKLMYFFGAWISKETIAAESDREAIFDADMSYNASKLTKWNYPVALFCGNRKVKEYNAKTIHG